MVLHSSKSHIDLELHEGKFLFWGQIFLEILTTKVLSTSKFKLDWYAVQAKVKASGLPDHLKCISTVLPQLVFGFHHIYMLNIFSVIRRWWKLKGLESNTHTHTHTHSYSQYG